MREKDSKRIKRKGERVRDKQGKPKKKDSELPLPTHISLGNERVGQKIEGRRKRRLLNVVEHRIQR